MKTGVRMLRRVAGVDGVGELDVLTLEACEQVAETVLRLRDCWTLRSPRGHFFTLGANAYMDLAHAADPASYHRPAEKTNVVLKSHFAGVYDALAGALAEALGMPVRYADDLALPGFHVWTADGIPQQASASVHFDLQYNRLLSEPAYAKATGTVSFTIPIRLPAKGSSLRVWPDVRYQLTPDHRAAAEATEPLIVDYHLGQALVHSGHLLHQIGATESVTPDDVRITMQGHGLLVDGEIVCYW